MLKQRFTRSEQPRGGQAPVGARGTERLAELEGFVLARIGLVATEGVFYLWILKGVWMAPPRPPAQPDPLRLRQLHARLAVQHCKVERRQKEHQVELIFWLQIAPCPLMHTMLRERETWYCICCCIVV